MMKKNRDFIDEVAEQIPEYRVKRAFEEAEKEILQIRLSNIREKLGIRQEDIRSFTQSGVSKLEARKDMKVSTLVEYLHDLGLTVEIKAYSQDRSSKKKEEFILLKK